MTDLNHYDEFIAEIRDDIERLEPDLLTMEELGSAVTQTLINRAFRAIHSIKGGAGFCGLTEISLVSHSMENLLMDVREKKLEITLETVDTLFQGLDKIKQLIAPQPPHGNAGAMGQAWKAGKVKEPENKNNPVYVVRFDGERDLLQKGKEPADLLRDIKAAGEVLFFDLDKDLPEAGLKTNKQEFTLVISTILDAEFLSQVLEVPREGISRFDPGTISEPGDQKSNPPETIRVNVDLITRLMNFAGELVLSRNQLRPFVETHAGNDRVLNNIMQNLDMVTSGIQEDIMQIRMQPVGSLLKRFKRIIRDTAKNLSKKVSYTMEGGEVEIDRTVIEGLFNPMTHLMRNCVDHGIETPCERKKKGKPETGAISIKAFHQGGNIHINIFDDGIGLDPEKIANAAIKKKIVSKALADKMTDKEKIDLIFSPGLSTRDTITDVSGRGVGMDVVKTNIEALGGHIDIDSTLGQGTKVQVIIPLTLAILPAVIVGTDKFKYAIPQANVSEIVYLESADLKNNMEKLGNSEVILLRQNLLPVVRLRTLLGIDEFYADPGTGERHLDRRSSLADRRNKKNDRSFLETQRKGRERRKNRTKGLYVVIIKAGINRFGLCVETLFNTEEIVVKPLSHHIKECRCFNGATILGDGRVIMILDASGMANHANLKFTAVNTENDQRAINGENKSQKEKIGKNVIVFTNADDEFFAVELSRMARLERISPHRIHRSGNFKFMAYQEKGLPLFHLEELIRISACPRNLKELYIIIPKHLPTRCGIIVSDVIDTMELFLPVQTQEPPIHGVAATTFVNGRLVQLLDMNKIENQIESLLDMDRIGKRMESLKEEIL